MLKFLIAALTGLREIFAAIKRDLHGLWLVFTIESKLKRLERTGKVLDDMFNEWAVAQPDKPCIIFNDTTWTFRQMRLYSNRIANLFAHRFKLKKGDCVAVFMDNKPEYVGLWLGLSKMGVITALINTNLKSQQLMHTLENAKPKLVIYSMELEPAIKAVKVELNGSLKIMSETELSELVEQTSDESYIPSEKILPHDVIMYIYTSGTTGLPKPAVIKHSRYCAGGFVFFHTSGLKPSRDIVYVTLPIYHANGAIIGVGASIVAGATVVLRKKFSASNFWSECIRYNCTAFIYVGEICRYLVNQPASALDRQHRVKVAIGNGLRANVWRDFNNRFGVRCLEFYAASEGNCTMVNITSKLGACGFVPLVNSLVPVLPVKIIRIDDQMNPIRDERGFCMEARAGEKGLLVGIIGKSTKTAFNGYANNAQASNKKIINDLFKTGQRAFNSGDLMMKDRLGYVYFCDRLGDTFRWRGENVATIEVENTISRHLNSAEVCVYGVEIPGQEGRCGMAAIAKRDLADPRAITRAVLDELPAYARPLFIRLVDEIDHTGSFKAKKTRLVDEGFNIGTFQDSVYYLNVREQAYKPLTHAVYMDILNGNYSF